METETDFEFDPDHEPGKEQELYNLEFKKTFIKKCSFLQFIMDNYIRSMKAK
jgi:hypothetical protein